MKPVVLTRTVLGVILAGALALGLGAPGCGDTSSKPVGPFPGVDGGNGSNPNGDGGIGQDGGQVQDAPAQPGGDAGF